MTTDTDLAVGLADVQAAAERIRGHAVRTPLLPTPWPGLSLKPEFLQPVGAFKIRGALNAIARLSPEERRGGVLAHSSGNHAQAVAYAARVFGIAAHIVIPDNAAPGKIAATRALGATVELVPLAERFSRPEELARATGKPMIPPFDHPDVIAGQGTVGLEIAADDAAHAIHTVLVPVSGGGLLSGIATVLAALRPDITVVGVEPELAGDAAESLRTGTRHVWPAEQTARTVADGLRTPSLGQLPWALIHRYVHHIVTVSEEEILEAVKRLAVQAKVVAEPSGAVPVAAFLHHRDEFPAGPAVAVVSGGNIDPALLARLLAE